MYIFYSVLFSLILSQTIKIVIDIKNKKRFHYSFIFSNGGMPSTHSALVASLSTAIFLKESISTSFLISIVLALIVIRDATGVRLAVSNNARIINELNGEINKNLELKSHLNERIGHTHFQALAGIILGFLVSLFFYFI